MLFSKRAEKTHYSPLEEEADELHENNFNSPRNHHAHFTALKFGALVLNLILFCISLTILTRSTYPNSLGTQKNAEIKRVNSFSPFLERFELAPKTQMISGQLFNDPQSIYRLEPSEEVDEAWEAVSQVGFFVISGEEVAKLGKDPLKTVKLSENMGYGPDAHLAQLDGQHALHCLNVLRRFAYFYYYFEPEFGNFSSLPDVPKIHLSHCLHVVLQALTCRPSMGVVTHNWMETQHTPFPDFSIQQKCVNHDAILEWQASVNVSDSVGWPKISRPDDAYVFPAPPQLLALEN